jgi:sarcosine oxidase delta subunit
MDRVELHTEPPALAGAACWHCGRSVSGRRVARYLYPGDRPRTAIVEDWHACPCGAFQNVRRPTEISISSLART